MRKISGDYDRDPLNLHWSPDSASISFDAEDHGSRNIHVASTSGGNVRQVTVGAHVLTMDSVSSDMTAVGTETDPDNPPYVVSYNLNRLSVERKLTSVNAGLLS